MDEEKMAEPTKSSISKLPITVSKPTPYTFDLGLLLSSDPNPLPFSSDADSNLEEHLASTARDGAQALLNQLLSTCPIASTPAGVLLSLPATETKLPREKPLPPPPSSTTTRWQAFAAKKGIKPKTAEQKKKLVYDEEKGDWVPKWGYKGKNKAGEGDWIVEVDEKKEKEMKEKKMQRKGKGKEEEGSGMGMGMSMGMGRMERKAKVRRQVRRERGNERRVQGRRK